MREYRDRARTSSDPPQTAAEEIPRYMTLAERYGLGDDMNIGGPSNAEETIEQEYQAYVTAVRSTFIDILKFWEVRFFI